MCRCERLVEETVSNEILDMCVDASAFANTYMREMFAALSQEALKFFYNFSWQREGETKGEGGKRSENIWTPRSGMAKGCREG